jgi:hypothetical protein
MRKLPNIAMLKGMLREIPNMAMFKGMLRVSLNKEY